MNLENEIKDIITKQLDEGIVEAAIEKHLTESIEKALGDLFGSYGPVTKAIKKEIESVIVPVLESYDYSRYIVKLDTVLTDLVKTTSFDNRKILENFKDIMSEESRTDTIKASHLFDLYKKHVSKNVDTSDLDIDYDDEVTYQNVEVTMEIEHEELRSWSSYKTATIIFKCEKDEEMNFGLRIYESKKGEWAVMTNSDYTLNSLRFISEFEILLMKLSRDFAKIELDTEYVDDEVEVENMPEATFE
jgi:hypothetical protein